MSYEAAISPVAALLADPGRAAMVAALLDGRALPAGDLARIAGVTAATASSHLAKLVDGGLLLVRRQGRHRYYAIASADIAIAIETLSSILPPPPVRSLNQSIHARALSAARSCYDHLAGTLAVRIADSLVTRGDCRPYDSGFELTEQGKQFFQTLGIDAPSFTRACIDWTERRPHISGPLGSALFHFLLNNGYIRRGQRHRAIDISDEGERALANLFNIA